MPLSWGIRRAFVVLLMLCVAAPVVLLEQALAQAQVMEKKAAPFPVRPVQLPNSSPDADEEPDGFRYSDISLLKDEHRRKKTLDAAVDYVERQDWTLAIECLQKLLEIKEDVFARLNHKKPDGKEVPAWVSVKQEADRLIGTLPPAGQEFYKLTYGAKAADLFKKAQESNDRGLLAELMKRYAHTDAGGEAIKILADYHLDRSNYAAAVLYYDKLLSRAGADQLPPQVLFEDEKWKSKGTPVRETSRHIQQAAEYLQGHHRPILPAFSPLTVTIAKGEKRLPLLIYRNYGGIVARDLKSGDLVWASPSNWSLECILDARADAPKTTAMTQWLQFYLDQGRRPEILFENSTVGTLSSDGKYVYAVEDLAVPPPPVIANMFNPGMRNDGNRTEIQDAIDHSRLQAFNLQTNGRLSWELGGEEKGPLSDCYFLGPPLPLDGKLYVLTEKQQELRLVCLDPEAGGVILSTQTLGTAREKMYNDVRRRTNAVHLAYGEGILVCPTNAGAIFGINLLESRLVWAYPYRAKSDAPPGWQQRDPNGRFIDISWQNSSWKASAPIIADSKVIFTAPDALSLHCINLRDGSLIWHKPKQEDDLYLGNICNGKVLIVGKKSVRGLSLSTGETLWTIETGLPSGQGIGSGSLYYLPLQEGGRTKEPHICVIDMDKGKIVSSTPLQPRTVGGTDYDVPGNLLFYEGAVISLTHREVAVYSQPKVH